MFSSFSMRARFLYVAWLLVVGLYVALCTLHFVGILPLQVGQVQMAQDKNNNSATPTSFLYATNQYFESQSEVPYQSMLNREI